MEEFNDFSKNTPDKGNLIEEDLEEISKEKNDPSSKKGVRITHHTVIKNDVIMYTIEGAPLKEPIKRRYREFDNLREKLIQRWPGILVPLISPKRILKNGEKSIVIERKRVLSLFCKKLFSKQYFAESDEIKLFFLDLKTFPESITQMNQLPKRSYKQLYECYEKYFNDIKDEKIILDQKNYDDCLAYIDKWVYILKQLKDKVCSFVNEKNREIKTTYRILKSIEEYEKSTLYELSKNDMSKMFFFNLKNSELTEKMISYRSSMKNPFMVVFQWLEEKVLDLNALKDALLSYNNLLIEERTLFQEIEGLKKRKEGYNNGKRNLIEIITFKKEENLIKTCEEQINTKSSEIEYLKKVISIVQIILYKTISEKKQDIEQGFKENIANFYKANIENSQKTSELWKCLK